jgi:hypothetical protein
MDDSSKIALGIIAAAFLLGVMYIGYREYDRHRDIQEVQDAFGQFAASVPPVTYSPVASVDPRAAADLAARRQLRADQRCLAGTVVSVNGSAYTQDIGADGRPVRCSGREVLR